MLGLDGHGIFVERIGVAVLVVVFDKRTSLGVIRLRVRKAREAIAAVVISIISPRPDRLGPN